MHLKTDTGANAHFANVPTISRGRNAFSVSEKHVTTCQFDYLYPISSRFIYPGDTASIEHHIMARLQTQIATLYDDLYFDVHAWFVPFRLIQTNWARYQFNAQPLGPSQDNSALTSPSINLVTLGAGGFPSKSLYDYLGYPTKINLVTSGQHINNYYARAYNMIWNENYRDQNLQNPVVVDLDEGPDLASNYVLLKRGRRHDVFSSSLPFAQKGAAVTLPLGTSAPVTGPVWGSQSSLPLTSATMNNSPIIGTYFTGAATPTQNSKMKTQLTATSIPLYNPNVLVRSTAGTASGTGDFDTVFYDETRSKTVNPTATAPFVIGNGAIADLSSAIGATVNQVRQSYAVQQLLEADARGGTRDVEAIQHRWGVTVPDFRLQRPEFLGGCTFTFDGHVVPQTSATVSGQSPQATLTQFSETMSSLGVNHSFVEHGVMMVLLSLRSNLTYQEGLPRELSYKTRFGWYQPEFANLGEVSVLNKEIYLQGTSADDLAWGYQEYGFELRYGRNRVSSEMRSNYATTLDSRHMADDYTTLPVLGAAWIQSNTPISRNIAVSAATSDPVQLNTLAKGTLARTLPMYSIPGLKRL